MTKLTSRSRKKPVRLTKERQARAIALLESGEFICDVADQIGVTRQAIFKLRKRNEAFRIAWDEAAEIGEGIQASLCEQEMDFRGRIGWLEPKFFEGHVCGFVKNIRTPFCLHALRRSRQKPMATNRRSTATCATNTAGQVGRRLTSSSIGAYRLMKIPKLSELIPPYLYGFFAPGKRFYVVHGGRGSSKSWSVATYLVLEGFAGTHRILCCREIQKSIRDSVKKLLDDTIGRRAFMTLHCRQLGDNDKEATKA